jgi:hypothetical protein
MYPAVPSIVGTKMTYANESHAVRFVQRKYLWRLTVMSVGRCQHLSSLHILQQGVFRRRFQRALRCILGRGRTVPFYDCGIRVEHCECWSAIARHGVGISRVLLRTGGVVVSARHFGGFGCLLGPWRRMVWTCGCGCGGEVVMRCDEGRRNFGIGWAWHCGRCAEDAAFTSHELFENDNMIDRWLVYFTWDRILQVHFAGWSFANASQLPHSSMSSSNNAG